MCYNSPNRGIAAMAGFEGREIGAQLEAMRKEHRSLDDDIAALITGALALQQPVDQLHLARLKKRKLRLKDEIIVRENELIPDILA